MRVVAITARHRRGVGPAGAGDGEGGTVIDRGADEGQAEGPVGGETERRALDCDQPLVVIERQDPIELFARQAREERVRALRPPHVDPPLPRFGDRGYEDLRLLAAEQSALAGMRIDSGEGDASTGMALEAGERFEDALPADPVERLAQRHVDREQRHLHSGSEERHQVVAAVAFETAGGSEIVGMPDEAGEEMGGNRFLRHRRGDDRVDGTGAGERYAGVESRHRAVRIGSARTAELDPASAADRVEQSDLPGEPRERRAVGGLDFDQAIPWKLGHERRDRLESGPFGDQQSGVGGNLGGGVAR